MAIQFVNNVDFNANQAQSIRIENVATDPSTELVIGRIIFNTAADTLKQYVADDGSGSPGWVEVGSSSGVETFTNTSGTFVSFGTDNSSAVGDVSVGTVDLSAGGTPSATTFLRGDNNWESAVTSVGLSMPAAFTVTNSPVTGSGTLTVTGSGATSQYVDGTGALQTFPTIPTVPSNIVETITTTDGTYIELTPNAATDGNVTVTADLSAVDGTAGANERYLTKNNTWATVASIPGTYSFNVTGDTGTPETIDSGNTLDIAGGTNISTVVGATDTVTVNLDDSISLSGSLTVGTTGDFTGQVTVPTATAGTSAPNLAQVQSLIAGVGVFQGGYDATNDPGSPNISGSSNVALDTGDFYVVTVDGDITFSDQTVSVEVGDLIFANTDISANSNPASTDYTFVIQDQNIAGEGATDAATEKGVAGFNSAHFSVTANGFVSADIYGGGSTLGIVPSGGSASTFLRGDGTFATPTNTTYTADVGLTLSGTQFSVNVVDSQTTQVPQSITTTSNRLYQVETDDNDMLVVNVPWTDTTGAVTSVDETTPGTSSGTPIVVNPTTGNVLVKSMAYDGGSNVGHVPSGGSATTFLRGDGTWVTPTDTGASGVRISLDGSLAYVTRTEAGGLTTFAVAVNNSNVLSAASALDVKAEIITSGGQTVYADVTRSGTTLSVIFTGSVANATYSALLVDVG